MTDTLNENTKSRTVSDTPETDAESEAIRENNSEHTRLIYMSAHARKLERERNELEEKLEELREYLKALPILKPEPNKIDE